MNKKLKRQIKEYVKENHCTIKVKDIIEKTDFFNKDKEEKVFIIKRKNVLIYALIGFVMLALVSIMSIICYNNFQNKQEYKPLCSIVNNDIDSNQIKYLQSKCEDIYEKPIFYANCSNITSLYVYRGTIKNGESTEIVYFYAFSKSKIINEDVSLIVNDQDLDYNNIEHCDMLIAFTDTFDNHIDLVVKIDEKTFKYSFDDKF